MSRFDSPQAIGRPSRPGLVYSRLALTPARRICLRAVASQFACPSRRGTTLASPRLAIEDVSAVGQSFSTTFHSHSVRRHYFSRQFSSIGEHPMKHGGAQRGPPLPAEGYRAPAPRERLKKMWRQMRASPRQSQRGASFAAARTTHIAPRHITADRDGARHERAPLGSRAPFVHRPAASRRTGARSAVDSARTDLRDNLEKASQRSAIEGGRHPNNVAGAKHDLEAGAVGVTRRPPRRWTNHQLLESGKLGSAEPASPEIHALGIEPVLSGEHPTPPVRSPDWATRSQGRGAREAA